MKKLTLVGILATFLAVGCADNTELEQPNGQWNVNENNQTAELGCTPEAEPVWTTTKNEPWFTPGRMQFSQNDGLVSMPSTWLRRDRVQRTHDGARFETPGSGRIYALDKSWDLATFTTGHDRPVAVTRRSTGETVLEMTPDREDADLVAAEIAASGRSALALTCAEGQFRMLRWTLEDGRQTHDVPVGAGHEYCDSWNTMRSRLLLGPAENFVVIVSRSTGELVYVDLENGATTAGRVEVADQGEVTSQWGNGVILDAHIDPNGQRLLLSTSSGRVEIRRLPGFERTASFDSGVTLLNEITYAPRIKSSPVAWAPDGRRFVSVSDEGDVVLRNLDGEILQAFPGAIDEPHEMWGMEDVPVALQFSHDGTRLAVGHYFGAAMYACDDAEFPRSDERFDADVSIDGPSQISTDQAYEWTVTVDGHPGAVRRMLIDGERARMRSDGVLNWRAYEPGVYELVAEVDDGRATGRASMTVTVE